MPARALVICALFFTVGALDVESRTGPSLRLRMLDGHALVDGVFVNGHGPYRFLLDTGTSLNHLDRKLARAAGLTEEFRTKVASATGTSVLAGVRGVEISLNEARAGRQPVLLGGLDAIHLLSTRIQGVLGQAFLSRFDYLLDLRNGRLVFGPLPTAGTRVPLVLVDGRPAVDTNLGRLLLDSGAHGLVLFNVATTSATRELLTLGGPVYVGTVPRELRISGHVFWRGDAVGVPSTEVGLAGLLPTNIFRSVYVCNSEGYVVLN